jgi:hypothetical protein
MAPVQIQWPDQATAAATSSTVPRPRSPVLTVTAGLVVGLALGLGLARGPAGDDPQAPTAVRTTPGAEAYGGPLPGLRGVGAHVGEPQASETTTSYSSANAAERRAFDTATSYDVARAIAIATWPGTWRQNLAQWAATASPTTTTPKAYGGP